MTRAAVTKLRETSGNIRQTREQLDHAMSAAETAGQTIPCKADPGLWTSDVLATQSYYALLDAETAAQQCADCPVLTQCAAYSDAHPIRGEVRLYGVVAGRLHLPGSRKTLINHGRTPA
jgi:hypothetical protein